MRGIGGLMILLGAGSFILNLLGLEFMLLMWIDYWGVAAGIAIRVGMCVVGGLLVVLGSLRQAD
jgi:hypothetical protein